MKIFESISYPDAFLCLVVQNFRPSVDSWKSKPEVIVICEAIEKYWVPEKSYRNELFLFYPGETKLVKYISGNSQKLGIF